jgi:CHAT domain-containing protein
LATHGYFRGDNPLFSRLQLAGEGLTVSQVYDRPMQASLVTLSACETGLNQLRGSDLIGLTGAFLYAGAASLVVSLWQVQDESTAQLMQKFYQQLSQGLSKAAALRAAQLELLASEQFGAPFYWAPFVLYGDTGVLDVGVP